MSQAKTSEKLKSGTAERASQVLRDFNLFVGGVALGGAILLPPLAVPLTAYGAFNVAQAGGFEAARRYAKNRRQKKQVN